MVRLLPGAFMIDLIPPQGFQSHNGAIAAFRIAFALAFLSAKFQSHNGAIAASSSPLQKQVTKTFQSHNGAIAAINPTLADNIATGFNPTMVRLLHFLLSSSSVNLLVSIPQWCDCCRLRRENVTDFPWFQSHNGAIAA